MHYTSKIDEINRIESRDGWYDISYKGFSIWRLSRDKVLERYLVGNGYINRKNNGWMEFSSLLKIPSYFLLSVIGLLSLKRKKFLMLGFSRRTLYRGRYVDRFHDPLVDVLGESESVLLERPYQKRHAPSRSTSCKVVFLDAIIYMIEALSILMFPYFWLRLHGKVERLNELLKSNGVVVDHCDRLMILEMSRFLIGRILYRFVMWKIKPERILLTSRWLHFSIISLAKEMGVPTFELQHGCVLNKTIGYSNSYVKGIDPDYFLTFGNYWAVGYNWGVRKDCVIPIGYKFLSDIDGVGFPPTSKSPIDKILVVSQPELNAIIDDDLFKLAKNNDCVKFYLKLHPQDIGRWPERYPNCAGCNNVVFIDEPGYDVYHKLNEFDLVLGYGSTLIYEASYLKRKVGLIDLSSSNHCAAMPYLGKYGFFSVRSSSAHDWEFDNLELVGERGSPFFQDFDCSLFKSLMRG